MTWEWVALISVLVLCATILILKNPKNATCEGDIESRLAQIDSRLSQIEKEHATIHQLAGDTKKLLSEANLAKGFRPQR